MKDEGRRGDGAGNPAPPTGFEPLPAACFFPALVGPFYIKDRNSEAPTVGAWIGNAQCNSASFAHGGFLLAFADLAMTMTTGGITLNLSVDFMRGVPLGTWIEAQVLTRKRTPNLIFADAVGMCGGKVAFRMNGLFKPFEKTE